MKKNNKGFMLVEALIMSVVVIGVLIFMYVQFQNISKSYDKSFHYNTVTDLYMTNEIKEYLKYNDKIKDLLLFVDASPNKYVEVSIPNSNWSDWDDLIRQCKISHIYIADEELSELKGKRTAAFTEKMNDFINYLKVDKLVEEEPNDSNKTNIKYRIMIEFNDNTFASLKLEG